MTYTIQQPMISLRTSARRALRVLAALAFALLCLDAHAVDDLPWAAIKGVSAVSDYTPDGVPIDFVFAPTENILDGGQVWYRSVKHFGNAHEQAWDPQGWREIPGGMRTSYRLASAWVHKPGVEMPFRKAWIAAIDSNGNYRIASYNPWHNTIGDGWGGWSDMGKPSGVAYFNGPPSIVAHGNYVRLFATSNDKLWMRTYNGVTDKWSEWSQESGMTLRAGTGVAASPMYMNFASDEKAVLVAVKDDYTIVWRVYGHGADNSWRAVPGVGLTHVTPALARSSSTRLRLIVGTSTSSGPGLFYQTLTDSALWTGWKLLSIDHNFDMTPGYLHGGGGPSATYLPPTNVIGGSGPGRDLQMGALHVYMDGSGDFQSVYAARMMEWSWNQGPVGDLHPNNGCIVNCSGFPVWQEIPGTAVPTPTLQPIPTMPQQIPQPHHPMVGVDGPEQRRPCAPLFPDIRVARHPYYGTDILLGRTNCGGKTRLYYRSGSNLGTIYPLWDGRGWIQIPGNVDAYHGHDIATVGNRLWVATVTANGRIQILRSTLAYAIEWDEEDITASLSCGPQTCPLNSPSIVVANGLVWIWVTNAYGQSWSRKYSLGAAAWQGDWELDNDEIATGAVAGTEIVLDGKKRTLLVTRSTNNAHGYIYYKVPELFNHWKFIPGNGVTDAHPAVARGADNKVFVIVRGNVGGKYFYQTLTDGVTWRPSWTELPGGGVFHTGNSRGPAAVFRAGGYIDPATPMSGLWDPSRALHVYGGAGTDGKSIFGTSFVANGSALQLREYGWTPVPSTAPIPLPPAAPKPPTVEGPDGTVIPPPPQPGTPEWNTPIISEPVNQWYPFCLAWSQRWNNQWWDEWSKTIYYPGESFTDADNLGLEVMRAKNLELHPDNWVEPGEYAYQSWAPGPCP